MYIFLLKEPDSTVLDGIRHAVGRYSSAIGNIYGQMVARQFIEISESASREWELIEKDDIILLHNGERITFAGKISVVSDSENLSRMLLGKRYKSSAKFIGYWKLYVADIGIEALTNRNLASSELTHLSFAEVRNVENSYGDINSFIHSILDVTSDDQDQIDENSEDRIEREIKQDWLLTQVKGLGAAKSNKRVVAIDEEVKKDSDRSASRSDISHSDNIEILELQRVARLFEPSDSKDLAVLDKATREKSVKGVIQNYSDRNSYKRPEVLLREVRRLKRDYGLVRALKSLYENKCQICGFTFKMSNGDYYSEAAHINPIASRDVGVDTARNILILCANHHKMLDNGAVKILSDNLCVIDGEELSMTHIDIDDLSSDQLDSAESSISHVNNIPIIIKDESGNVIADNDTISPLMSQKRLNTAASYVASQSKLWPKGRGRK